MSMVRFFVPGLPVTEGSTRAYVRGGRPVVVHDKQMALEAWRRRVRTISLAIARSEGWELGYDGPVEVRAQFSLPRPKRPKHPAWASTRPDLDKLQRAIGDSLAPKNEAGILKEDSRIVKWVASKVWARDSYSVGAHITVIAL